MVRISQQSHYSSNAMLHLESRQFPILSDNYLYILYDKETRVASVIDPSIGETAINIAAIIGCNITHVLGTHHHWDHTHGINLLKKITAVSILSPIFNVGILPIHSVGFQNDGTLAFNLYYVTIIAAPGHTYDHIMFWFEDIIMLLSGDTLFSSGCGKLFEGSPRQMWCTLQRLQYLPCTTAVYCSHEYTLSNTEFSFLVDRKNVMLRKRYFEVVFLRHFQHPTVPVPFTDEELINPFLRADSLILQATLKLNSATMTFSRIRQYKDAFI